MDVARNPAAPIELTGPAPAIGSSAVAAGPAAPASGPQGAPTSLLGTEATRRVIREIGRQDTLSERAARATGLPLQSSDARMAEAAARAGKGDCLKGEYLGGGACLLSAPFLALAAARGQCAR